jgi:hypothetical protein
MSSRHFAAAAFALLLAACGRGAHEGFAEVRVPALEGLSGVTGAAAFDADGDGRLDILVLRGASAPVLLLGDGKGGYRAKEGAFPRPDFTATAVAAADYDGDGGLDVLLSGTAGSALYRNDGKGGFSDATAAAGLPPRRGGRAAFLDADSDGHPDLFLTGARAAFYRNRGDGTFVEATPRFKLTGGGGTSAFPSDFDHDRDTDLIVADSSGPARALRNDRQEGFADVSAASGLDHIVGAGGLVVADLDGDRQRDILILSSGCAANRLFLRRGYGRLEEAAAPGFLGRGGSGVAAWDFDNDGALDLFITGACAPGGRLLLKNGGGVFTDASGLLPAARGGAQAFALGDYDGDGAADLILVEDGKIRLLRNETGGRNFRLQARLRGAQGSSRDGLGAKVDVKAGALWIERELNGMTGSASQCPGVLDLGTGPTRPEMMRITWPTGIRQKFTGPAMGRTLEIVEKPCRPMGHGCAEESDR